MTEDQLVEEIPAMIDQACNDDETATSMATKALELTRQHDPTRTKTAG